MVSYEAAPSPPLSVKNMPPACRCEADEQDSMPADLNTSTSAGNALTHTHCSLGSDQPPVSIRSACMKHIVSPSTKEVPDYRRFTLRCAANVTLGALQHHCIGIPPVLTLLLRGGPTRPHAPVTLPLEGMEARQKAVPNPLMLGWLDRRR